MPAAEENDVAGMQAQIDRLVATRADATHFIGCKGMLRVENCLFEHMLDDAINVHGAYVKVVEYLGDKAFLCEISHFQQWGLIFAEAGDKLALLSRETVLPFFETTVTKTKVCNEHRVVVTVSKVPEQMPEGPLSIENLTWYPDLVMRKNIVRENRARSVLVTTKGNAPLHPVSVPDDTFGITVTVPDTSLEPGGFTTATADAAHTVTLAEYLEDYARNGTKEKGYKLIQKNLQEMNGDAFLSGLEDRLVRIKQGERDLYF